MKKNSGDTNMDPVDETSFSRTPQQETHSSDAEPLSSIDTISSTVNTRSIVPTRSAAVDPLQPNQPSGKLMIPPGTKHRLVNVKNVENSGTINISVNFASIGGGSQV
jgi:hypothetical protein